MGCTADGNKKRYPLQLLEPKVCKTCRTAGAPIDQGRHSLSEVPYVCTYLIYVSGGEGNGGNPPPVNDVGSAIATAPAALSNYYPRFRGSPRHNATAADLSDTERERVRSGPDSLVCADCDGSMTNDKTKRYTHGAPQSDDQTRATVTQAPREWPAGEAISIPAFTHAYYSLLAYISVDNGFFLSLSHSPGHRPPRR